MANGGVRIQNNRNARSLVFVWHTGKAIHSRAHHSLDPHSQKSICFLMTNNVQMVSPSQDEASDKAIEKMDFETLFSCAYSLCLLAQTVSMPNENLFLSK